MFEKLEFTQLNDLTRMYFSGMVKKRRFTVHVNVLKQLHMLEKGV